MKWSNYITSIIGYFSQENDDYYYLDCHPIEDVKIPDSPLYYAVTTMLDSFQSYVVDPFVIYLQRQSLDSSILEYLVHLAPHLIHILLSLFKFTKKVLRHTRRLFFHQYDRMGFISLVSNNIKEAYAMTSEKFHKYFQLVHTDIDMEKAHKMTESQQKDHNLFKKLHKEALCYWMLYESILKSISSLLEEIELVQEWMLLKAICSNSTEFVFMWRKWDTRRLKLQAAAYNKISDMHHKFINDIMKLFMKNNIKPVEYYVHLYQSKLKRDKEILSVGNVKLDSIQFPTWIQRDILTRIVYKNTIYSFLKRRHHLDLMRIVTRNSDAFNKTVLTFIMIKNEIDSFKQKLYGVRMWYSYHVVNDILLTDFYEKWKELNLELSTTETDLNYSFQKQITTIENKKKNIQSRIIQSLKNKVIRKTIYGSFFDKTQDLDSFEQFYKDKRQLFHVAWNDIFNIVLFYKDAQANMKATTITRKKSFTTIENFF